MGSCGKINLMLYWGIGLGVFFDAVDKSFLIRFLCVGIEFNFRHGREWFKFWNGWRER